MPLLLIYRRIQAPQRATILFPVLFSVRCTCTISFQQDRTTYFSVTIIPVTNMFSITSLHHHNRALLQNIETFQRRYNSSWETELEARRLWCHFSYRFAFAFNFNPTFENWKLIAKGLSLMVFTNFYLFLMKYCNVETLLHKQISKDIFIMDY